LGASAARHLFLYGGRRAGRAANHFSAGEYCRKTKAFTVTTGVNECHRDVAVEKGTKAVISTNFSVHGERTFNNLRTNFDVGIP
jgi:hypothetical protein